MSTNFIYADPPNSVTHSALDFFTTSRILIDFQRSYHEQVYPHTNADAPVLEFEFQGPKTEISGTVIDLKNLFLKVELKLVHKSGVVKKDGTAEAQTKRPLFINNLGQSLFHNVEVILNGTSVSSSNNLHPYKAILEADLSHQPITKEVILRAQGYFYEPDPSDINDETDSSPFGVRRLKVDQSEKNLSFYFPLSDSFLSGIDKYILPGVETRIKLTRSINQFVLLHNNVSSKSVGNYSLQIVSASLSVHMLELRSESFLSIEKALLKKAAQYDYKDVIAKTFLISEGTSIYYKDDVFDRAPISRLVFAMVPEKDFTGDYKTNPFHFQDFNLGSVKITREGAPMGATPIDVSSSHIRAYFTSMKALGFEHSGNGVILNDFEHHFCLAFQLTADLLIDDGTIRPELTGARLGLELKFTTVTGDPIRLIVLGERRSVVFIDRHREVVKNSTIYNG